MKKHALRFFLIFLLLSMSHVASAGSCEKLLITGHPSYAPVAWQKGGAIVGASAKKNEVVKSPFSSCLKIERAKRRLDPHYHELD